MSRSAMPQHDLAMGGVAVRPSVCLSVCLSGHFRYYKRFHCLYFKNTVSMMYEVKQLSDIIMWEIFSYCCIRPEGLSYGAERELLAIAKFLCNHICAILYSLVFTVFVLCLSSVLWFCFYCLRNLPAKFC